MPRKEELQAPASAPPAPPSGADLCTWTAAQPGRGAATGLEWREQAVGRKTATLLSLNLTLAQCRVSLFLGTSSAALEATDFMFTLDMVSSLDAFRRRCLAELGLEEDEEFRGAAQALQRLFGIYLGSARLTWTEGTPTTLLALSGAPSVTFRWKDVFGVSESSQPIEGCIHNVQILVDVNAFTRLVEIVKDIALPFAELLEPPPFATSWCRMQLHQLQLELPAKEAGAAGGGSPLPKIKVALPSLLVTSLGGLGELFTSLESLPRHAWQSTRDEDQSTGDLEVVEPEPCACGRQLGRHCFGAGLAPLRGLGSQRAWRARQVERGELVPIGYDEFAEMLRTHLSACALQAVLEAAEPADAEGGFFQAEQVSAQAGSPSGRSAGKRKSRGWLSGFKSSTKSGSSVSQRATEAATEWATLHEGLQRLRRQREEASLRLRALHEAQAEEARRIEARTASLEEEITLKIALERGKQAELSAKAEEQRQVLAQLLRARRAEQMKAAKP
ncbi:unnamed protein product [Effrenium voratum]|nr:unnamed protein product [Effrenium voratum]